jgi:hypothetical protein
VSTLDVTAAAWSEAQLKALRHMDVTLYRARRPRLTAATPSAAGLRVAVAEHERQAWLASPLWKHLSLAAPEPLQAPACWADPGQAAIELPALAELRRDPAAKRRLWRALATWLR